MEKRESKYDWQRQFSVTDHVKHKKGFTLYKITSVVFPKKNPEAGTRIVVWKRFNEFKTLYKQLKRRHEELRIGGEFPKFIKSSFFKRFSEEVIKERKNCISNLLNFVAKCPALFTADVFVKFFREGYQISEYDDRKHNHNDSYDEESEVDSILLSLNVLNMGQVLNTEESLSSDESGSDDSLMKKRKSKNHFSSYHPFKRDMRYDDRYLLTKKFDGKGIPNYWEEAIAHADEAQQQEMLANYDVAFAMYKTAICCLLSGIQGDTEKEHRTRVKELTQELLHKAEWIYRHHLVCQDKPVTPKSPRVPWRSRSQLNRYKVLNVLSNNLLVHDVTENTFVVIKGVLKSSCPLDRSEICVLPKNVSHVVQLYALHETETTVFFVLEHIRYGKLWDHLEYHFNGGYVVDNLDTEMTRASSQNKGSPGLEMDRVSISSSGSSTNDQSLSRLESSIYTDTMSCESLSSHDENYFDLIEDYARAKSQKLKEIHDFNERRQQVELLRPVKKTVSQVDLKSMDDNYGHYRSQSLSDLAHDNNSFDDDDDGIQVCCRVGDESPKLSSDDENPVADNELIDIDTQQLLRNAQRLIESINETLSKNENVLDEQASVSSEGNVGSESNVENTEKEAAENEKNKEKGDLQSVPQTPIDICIAMKERDFYAGISPFSESTPSITEEYSVTAILQRNGVTPELLKKWAAQILVAIDGLHQHGIICRDLNPNNILLADNGSVKLTYFYRYPNIDPVLSAGAKARLYVAPEVSNINSNITFAADWWSYGVILYELITGQTLSNNHPSGINSHTIIYLPDKIEVEAKSLLNELLRYDPNERLGAGISGVDDIKSHHYFRGTNWDEIS